MGKSSDTIWGMIMSLVVFIFAMPLQVVSQYSISGTVNNGAGGKIVLSRLYGEETINLDSVLLKKDCSFRFVFPDSQYVGVFRITAGNRENDFIFNHENIVFETDTSKRGKVNILKSVENTEYYNFLAKTTLLNDSIEKLTAKGNVLYEKDPKGNADELKKLAKQIGNVETLIRKISADEVADHPDMFASKLIRSKLLPDFKAYMKKKDAGHYPNEAAFLKEHFFDNVDFTDSTLLHSAVIFDKIGEYFQYYADPPSEDAYRKCIDFILVRTEANKNVNDYVMNTLIHTFEHTDWDGAYSYVAEKYLAKNTCGDDQKAKSLVQKTNTIKALKAGNKAPSIKSTDLSGKEIALDSIKSDYTLVLFWASWCEYCEKAIPEVENLYQIYSSKGLKILAVSLDTVRQNWSVATKIYNIPWINTCDLKGLESPAIKDYNVWRTPTFYLLDKDKKIIERPLNTAILKSTLKSLEWKN